MKVKDVLKLASVSFFLFAVTSQTQADCIATNAYGARVSLADYELFYSTQGWLQCRSGIWYGAPFYRAPALGYSQPTYQQGINQQYNYYPRIEFPRDYQRYGAYRGGYDQQGIPYWCYQYKNHTVFAPGPCRDADFVRKADEFNYDHSMQ